LELVKEGSKEIKWVLKGHKSGIDHLAFSPNGKYIVTVSNQDGSIFLWEEGESITKNRMSKTIAKVLFDSKGDLLAIGRGFIKLWPFQQGIAVRKEEADQYIIEGKTLSFGKKFSSQDFVDGVLLQKDEV
jgi:WD40 repeat protein